MDEGQRKLIEDKKQEEEYSIEEVLKLVCYGSGMREALEKVSKSHRGAIIVLSDKARGIAEGGFGINTNFTSQRLAELAKMDGAIIVDSKVKKILYANTLLVPDSKIKSKETGSKHKAAERTAKQFNVIVVVVSEKSSIISVYYGEKKYVLNEMTGLLYKAREAIENLERQKIELDSTLKKFDSIELSSSVNVDDLAHIVNKMILFKKDAEIASVYIAELGKHGETMKIRYNFVVSGIRDDLINIEKDYDRFFNISKVVKSIETLKTPTLDQSLKLLETNIRNSNDSKTSFSPLGYRLLSKLQLPKDAIESLANEFKGIKGILYSPINDLAEIGNIDEKKARFIKDFLTNKIVMVQ